MRCEYQASSDDAHAADAIVRNIYGIETPICNPCRDIIEGNGVAIYRTVWVLRDFDGRECRHHVYPDSE